VTGLAGSPGTPDGLAALAPAVGGPIAEDRMHDLVAGLALAPGRHALDLGCGAGELLLRVVSAHPAATGTGVDTRRPLLDRARRAAAEQALYDRVEFVEADVATFDDHGDLVLCVGSAWAWGGAQAALQALREKVEPGGVALFADRFWQRPPDGELRRRHGELPGLEGLLGAARSAGFAVERSEASTPAEWERFEREQGYRAGSRGALGFAWLVLTAP
jgi:SAM-dependent methyltransferase